MLTDLDKRRILLPTFTTTREGHLELAHQPGVRMMEEAHVQPGRNMEVGTKLITVVLKGDRTKHRVHVEGNLGYVPISPRSLIVPGEPRNLDPRLRR